MKGICELCGTEAKRITRHHIAYYPCKTVMVCRGCHNRIHKGDWKHLCPPNRHIRIFMSRKNYMINTHGALVRPLNEKELFLYNAFVKSNNEELEKCGGVFCK